MLDKCEPDCEEPFSLKVLEGKIDSDESGMLRRSS